MLPEVVALPLQPAPLHGHQATLDPPVASDDALRDLKQLREETLVIAVATMGSERNLFYLLVLVS